MLDKGRPMKAITIQGEVFMKGWTRCLDCNKRIKFCMRSDIMIIADGLMNLCTECYWDSYADDDKGDYKKFPIILQSPKL